MRPSHGKQQRQEDLRRLCHDGQVRRSDQDLAFQHQTMTDQNFTADPTSPPSLLEQAIQEIQQTPQEYLPSLLAIIRLFRESVTLTSAEESFRQGWQEAMTEKTIPVSQLWDGING